LLNDDTTDVGSVHLGIVYVAQLSGMAISVRETDKLTGALASESDVRAVADDLETWSRIVFDDLIARPARSRPGA
jgi:predicted NUDIX family phosphoesterase